MYPTPFLSYMVEIHRTNDNSLLAKSALQFVFSYFVLGMSLALIVVHGGVLFNSFLLPCVLTSFSVPFFRKHLISIQACYLRKQLLYIFTFDSDFEWIIAPVSGLGLGWCLLFGIFWWVGQKESVPYLYASLISKPAIKCVIPEHRYILNTCVLLYWTNIKLVLDVLKIHFLYYEIAE